ncbi:MAG: hypothetical protein PHG36_03630 [Dehalococcoidia bacterium]|nr:hypothetical protein [Dehalococcoidia bacterium]
MKKKSFLIPVAVLAASLVIDASAALPQSLTEQLNAGAGYTASKPELPKVAQNPFVLERSDSSRSQNVAAHGSHSSHASHASHVSSRY